MFSGWSTGVVSATPTVSSGGGWTTGSTLTSTGGGWSTGVAPASAPSGSGTWSFSDSGSGGGGTVQGTSGYIYSAPAYYNYSYQSGPGYYSLPGAGLYASLPGEGGAYTPIDFPLMHELMPGERLEDVNARGALAKGGVLSFLALGVIAALLLKK